MTPYPHWINGRPTPPAASVIERHSPGDGRLVSTYAAGTAADADAAVAAAKAALHAPAWRDLSAAARSALLARTAALIRRDSAALAEVECLESGKPLAQARDEMEWTAAIWDYASALARTIHGDTSNHLGPALLGLTLREPVGVVALITPWNFPLLVLSQKLPFALAAGCTAVVKPSEFTSGTTLRLAALLAEAGLLAGACNVVTGHGDPVGTRLCEHPDVALVSFTGSTAVGRRVAATAGQHLKKVALELGGKNPQLVFADADLAAAAEAVVFGVFFNMGECCNSGSRVLVQRSVADAFIERVVARSRALVTGDPLDPATKLGAIINAAQEQKIRAHVDRAVAAGARIRYSATPSPRPAGGRYVDPVVLDRVTPDMEIAREEVFGPVLAVLAFEDEAEALRIANATAYGLSASVWTRDTTRALTLARRLEAGTVWINGFMDGSPELPFGGYRQSGLGRELGPHALDDYLETKTVVARLAPSAPWAPPSA